jgi:hypothetical protein
MASVIEAIIFDSGSRAAVPHGIKIVRLAFEWTMLPVTEELLERLDPSSADDDRIPAGWALRRPVAARHVPTRSAARRYTYSARPSAGRARRKPSHGQRARLLSD